jgi:hypothetical protein
VELVLPSGEKVIANGNMYSDLFWALRGGGGSTFGVVTRVTAKTYPQPQISGLNFTFTPTEGSFDAYLNAGAHFLTALPNFLDSGLSGEITIDNGSFNAVLLAPNKSKSEVSNMVAPVLNQLSSMKISMIIDFVNGDQILNSTFGDSPAGLSIAAGSRLFSRSTMLNQTGMATILSNLLLQGWTVRPFAIGGGQVIKNKDLEIALNPAWRETYVHFAFNAVVANPAYNAMVESLQEATKLESKYLAPISIRNAAYFNEVSSIRLSGQLQRRS